MKIVKTSQVWMWQIISWERVNHSEISWLVLSLITPLNIRLYFYYPGMTVGDLNNKSLGCQEYCTMAIDHGKKTNWNKLNKTLKVDHKAMIAQSLSNWQPSKQVMAACSCTVLAYIGTLIQGYQDKLANGKGITCISFLSKISKPYVS